MPNPEKLYSVAIDRISEHIGCIGNQIFSCFFVFANSTYSWKTQYLFCRINYALRNASRGFKVVLRYIVVCMLKIG